MADRPEKQGESRVYSVEWEAQKFKPGQSGNPNGRPPRPSLESLVRDVMDEEIQVKVAGQDVTITKREAIARIVIEDTLKRKTPILKELLKREWPEVTRHELSGPGGSPIELEDARGRLAGRLSRLALQLRGGEVPERVGPNGSGTS